MATDTSNKHVKLSVQAVQELDKQHGHQDASRRTSVLSSNQMSEASAAPDARGRRKSILRQTGQSPMVGNRRSSRYVTSKQANESENIPAPVPQIATEPTYKMAPDDGKEFSAYKAKQIIKQVFDSHLKNLEYDPHRCRLLACELASVIKNKIKEADFPRYKIVCNVILGQNQDQGFETASRCVWDKNQDTWASLTYKSGSVFALAMVHAVYYE